MHNSQLFCTFAPEFKQLRINNCALCIMHCAFLIVHCELCINKMEKKRIALKKLLEAVEKEIIKKPDKKTLDRLSLFVGFQSWEDFQNALHGE